MARREGRKLSVGASRGVATGAAVVSGARLVGVDRWSNWPPEVQRLPRLGGMEAVLHLTAAGVALRLRADQPATMAALGGCVTVSAPDKPIVINLNININIGQSATKWRTKTLHQ